jgi:hypothetical protein
VLTVTSRGGTADGRYTRGSTAWRAVVSPPTKDGQLLRARTLDSGHHGPSRSATTGLAMDSGTTVPAPQPPSSPRPARRGMLLHLRRRRPGLELPFEHHGDRRSKQAPGFYNGARLDGDKPAALHLSCRRPLLHLLWRVIQFNGTAPLMRSNCIWGSSFFIKGSLSLPSSYDVEATSPVLTPPPGSDAPKKVHMDRWIPNSAIHPHVPIDLEDPVDHFS